MFKQLQCLKRGWQWAYRTSAELIDLPPRQTRLTKQYMGSHKQQPDNTWSCISYDNNLIIEVWRSCQVTQWVWRSGEKYGFELHNSASLTVWVRNMGFGGVSYFCILTIILYQVPSYNNYWLIPHEKPLLNYLQTCHGLGVSSPILDA